MIFATVGTHEDPFDRLIAKLDQLLESGILTEDVLIQYGSSSPPHYCRGEEMMSYDDVQAAMAEARIIITHGGPATIMQAMAKGKVPVVVPRNPDFGEHVDGHQIDFTDRLADRTIRVSDIAYLRTALTEYDSMVAHLPAPEAPTDRAGRFAAEVERVCQEVLGIASRT